MCRAETTSERQNNEQVTQGRTCVQIVAVYWQASCMEWGDSTIASQGSFELAFDLDLGQRSERHQQPASKQ